jgi:hypothetical protein
MRTYIDGEFAEYLFSSHDEFNSDDLIKDFEPDQVHQLFGVRWDSDSVCIRLRTFRDDTTQTVIEFILRCPLDVFKDADDYMMGIYGGPDDLDFPAFLIHLTPTF